jgi:hypothetical protein
MAYMKTEICKRRSGERNNETQYLYRHHSIRTDTDRSKSRAARITVRFILQKTLSIFSNTSIYACGNTGAKHACYVTYVNLAYVKGASVVTAHPKFEYLFSIVGDPLHCWAFICVCIIHELPHFVYWRFYKLHICEEITNTVLMCLFISRFRETGNYSVVLSSSAVKYWTRFNGRYCSKQ